MPNTQSPPQTMNRRQALKTSLTLAAWGTFGAALPLRAFPPQAPDEEWVPFLDMPRTGPHRLDWESLQEWLTPQDQVFNVQHYGIPEIDPDAYRLEISGLVNRPKAFSLEELQSRTSKDQYMTLECSGNGSYKGFINAIYNSKWTGVPLRPILEECGLHPAAKEIVFYGKDSQVETLRPGTQRELEVEVPFGRSLSVAEALKMPLLLAYQRNDKPLEQRNGAPLRLIVPGWYGIANVKWLDRIEVRDRRYMGKYMSREYVTVRGERQDGEIVYVESSVTRMNLKSIVARITRRPTQDGRIPLKAYGAAWSDGTAIKQVQVKLDDGQWKEAVLDAEPVKKYCWRFFSIDLGPVSAGTHLVVSRAQDVNGRVQPSAQDDEIALKKTYWEAYEQWPRKIEVSA